MTTNIKRLAQTFAAVVCAAFAFGQQDGQNPGSVDKLTGVVFRIHLEPSTNIGPAYPEILYDRIIKFSLNP